VDVGFHPGRGRELPRVIDNVGTWRTSLHPLRLSHVLQERLEGHIASQYLQTRSRPDVGGASNYSSGDDGQTTLRSEASYYGPAYMIDYLWHDYHGMGIESVLINCHYPVTPTRSCCSGARSCGAARPVRRPGGSGAAKFADFVGLGFQQDVEIWLHKTRIDNPLLCAEDGPVYQVRRWYEQFYRDVADVEPDMVARFEFEIDTTRAVAGWEARWRPTWPGPGQTARMSVNGGRPGPRMSGRPPSAPSSASVRRGCAGRQVQPQHTSVQWTAEAVRTCSEFAAAVSLGRPARWSRGAAACGTASTPR